MKPEEQFSNIFGLHELHNYIFAKKYRKILKEGFDELEQALYDDIPYTRTCPDFELGTVKQGGFNLENYVLDMIEKKEIFLKRLNRLRTQEELFEMAMDSLTPRERDVIQVHYFNSNNDLGLSVEFFQEVLAEAREKLCSFIGEERVKHRKAIEEEGRQVQREQLKRDIQSGRVRVV